MNGWTIAILIICGIELLLAAFLHGKPKDGNYNFWETLFTIILTILLVFYATGLF